MLLAPSKGVGELLQGMSCVSHLLLILFRTHRKRLISNQRYHDTQATVRAAFHLVVRAKGHCPAEPIFLWQLGSDVLENLLAVVRTLTHSRNCDANELGDRIGTAVSLVEIWSKYPEWARDSRTMNESTDHMSVRTWEGKGRGGPRTAPW